MFPRSLFSRPAQAFLCMLVAAAALLAPFSQAQGQSYDPDSILAAEGYITPPDTIAQAALAPRWMNFNYSNPNVDGSWFLQTLSDGLPHIQEFTKPYHELGGAFIDFGANRNRSLTTRHPNSGRLCVGSRASRCRRT